MRGWRTAAGVVLLAALIAPPPVGAATQAAQASGSRPVLTSNDWFSVVNFYRRTAALPPLRNEPQWTSSELAHSRYMAANRVIGHSETPGTPHYSKAGDIAARSSNVSLAYGSDTPRRVIERWMTGPFHALGILNPELQRTAFGQVRVGRWTGSSLDTARGISGYDVTDSVVWPANGMQVPVDSYSGTETPSPLTFCPGYGGRVGLPVVVILPEGVRVTGHTVTKGGAAVASCRFDSRSRGDAYGKQALASSNATVIMLRNPMTHFTPYTVTVTTTKGKLSSTFTAGEVTPPTVTLGGLAPIQNRRDLAITWSAKDTESGVASYDVRYRTAKVGSPLGAHTSWQTATTATTATMTGTPGNTYCFSARATDKAGNGSAWTAERCTSLPVRSADLTPSGVWLPQADPAYYDTAAMTGLLPGATLTYPATRVRRIAALVSTCSGCGALDVSLNGKRIGSVSLNGPTASRVLKTVAVFGTPQSGTVTMSVTSTLARTTVEGLGLAP